VEIEEGAMRSSCVAAALAALAVAGSPIVSAAAAPRIFRVILPVSDVEAAAGFYAALLGQPGQRVSGGRHYFDAGGVVLALLDPRADGDEYDPRPNLEPVYFAVVDLEAVFARARALGGLFEESLAGASMGEIAVRPWGERSFYLRDPFGNPLCFVDAATLFTGDAR
jgi:catechol 2,3-dioxygenase-like lactoylglutathione lyase family enzyme